MARDVQPLPLWGSFLVLRLMLDEDNGWLVWVSKLGMVGFAVLALDFLRIIAFVPAEAASFVQQDEAGRLAISGDNVHSQYFVQVTSPVSADSEDAFPGHVKLTPADEEIRRLRRDLARMKEERDILKRPPNSSSRKASEVSLHSAASSVSL